MTLFSPNVLQHLVILSFDLILFESYHFHEMTLSELFTHVLSRTCCHQAAWLGTNRKPV